MSGNNLDDLILLEAWKGHYSLKRKLYPRTIKNLEKRGYHITKKSSPKTNEYRCLISWEQAVSDSNVREEELNSAQLMHRMADQANQEKEQKNPEGASL